MSETRTVFDSFELKTVEISNRLVDRLRGKYASGPHLPNGKPEFGWRQFQAPPIQHEAAAEIERLQSRIEELEQEKDRLMLGSAKGRIKVIARGVSIQTHAFALAELMAEMAGPGAEIRYIPEGSEDGWRVWTEDKEWPDSEDFRYHLFALEVKALRRERQARTALEASNKGGK